MELLPKITVYSRKEKSGKSRSRIKGEEIQPDVTSAVDVAPKPKRGFTRNNKRKRWERVCGKVLLCRVFLSADFTSPATDQNISRFTVKVSHF